MERNLDKIKRLEHELGRYQKKVSDQHREISRLNQVSSNQLGALRELSMAVEADMIAVAVKFGAEVGEGVVEFVLPVPKIDELLGRYQMSVTSVDGQYIFRVKQKSEVGTDDPA